MAGRTVPEWVGDSADSTPPPRVRLRVFERDGGRCHRCTRGIRAGDAWTLEHLIALCNGGRNAETNLGLTCRWCLPEKNAEDVAEKAAVARVRSKHIGIKPRQSRPMPGSKASGIRKRMSGNVERW